MPASAATAPKRLRQSLAQVVGILLALGNSAVADAHTQSQLPSNLLATAFCDAVSEAAGRLQWVFKGADLDIRIRIVFATGV